MSPLTPDTPSKPLFRFSSASTSSTFNPQRRSRKKTTPGSRSPERVPITNPSSGVRPALVSIAVPCLTATRDEPLPRWQTIIRSWPRGF